MERQGRSEGLIGFGRRYPNVTIFVVTLVVEAAMFWGVPTVKGESAVNPQFTVFLVIVSAALTVIGLRAVIADIAELRKSAQRGRSGPRVRLPDGRVLRASGLGVILVGALAALVLILSAGHQARHTTYARPSAISLLVRRSRVPARGTMVWRGVLRGSSTPFELFTQIRSGGRWQTFDSLRTGRGHYVYAYTFHRAAPPTTYLFRVLLPADPNRSARPVSSNEVRVLVE